MVQYILERLKAYDIIDFVERRTRLKKFVQKSQVPLATSTFTILLTYT